MHTNRLAAEKSPYLLQHAHNPVDWYPWGGEAFEKARREDKPIFLSVGYSTCHWCHVMERESFESGEIAEVLNRYYVPVKVDREERPDVDRVYMTFVQATTGSGGWPMSVWLTPDRKPFFGGTYFPPDNRYGRPGFKTVLEYVAHAWVTDRPRILQSGDDILEELRKQTLIGDSAKHWLDESIADSCFQVFRRSYDSRMGGFGTAPKFPRPVSFHFLLRHYAASGNQEALDMTLHTLREMAKGGMCDQLGGGFHRYSVDGNWFVPHFEKMLYDQAQLAAAYLEAYQVTRDAQYASVARDILGYVLRDLTSPEGAFYSAEDADSVVDPAHPCEKGEGAFYIFRASEIEQALGPDMARLFADRYGVRPDGNVREDPHGEFTGRNILYQAMSEEEVARRHGVSETDVRLAMAAARRQLLSLRNRRVRPHLDDKILTAWNGLMISAFALGARALGDASYAAAARRAADFVLARMTQGDTLLRRYRDGEAAIPGFLDDYAFLIQGLIALYEASFEPLYLMRAIRLCEEMMRRFGSSGDGGFYSAAGDDPSLVLRMKDDYDGAEPAGNSAAAAVLVKLTAITGRDDFRQAADDLFQAFATRLRSVPHTIPLMVSACVASRRPGKQIVLAGERGDPGFDSLAAAVGARFLPDASMLHAAPELPATAAMRPLDGKAAVYVCENFTCRLPVTDPAQLSELL